MSRASIPFGKTNKFQNLLDKFVFTHIQKKLNIFYKEKQNLIWKK